MIFICAVFPRPSLPWSICHYESVFHIFVCTYTLLHYMRLHFLQELPYVSSRFIVCYLSQFSCKIYRTCLGQPPLYKVQSGQKCWKGHPKDIISLCTKFLLGNDCLMGMWGWLSKKIKFQREVPLYMSFSSTHFDYSLYSKWQIWNYMDITHYKQHI